MFIEAFMLAAPEIMPEAAVALTPELAGAGMGAEALGAGTAFMGATNAGILSALGAGGSGALAAPIMEGVAAGAGGAGAAGVNEAMVQAGQESAKQIANSGIQQAVQQAPTVSSASQLASAANTATPFEMTAQELEAAKDVTSFADAAETAKAAEAAKAAETTKDLLPEIKAGSAIDRPYIPQDAQFAHNVVPGGAGMPPAMAGPVATPNPLAEGFKTAMDFAKNNPFSAASMAYTGYNILNKKQPEQQQAAEYNGPLKNYKMSSNFKGRQANPEDYQYTPQQYHFADGGIASVGDMNQVAPPNNFNYAQSGLPTGQQQPMMPQQGITVGGPSSTPSNAQSSNLATGGIASYSSGGDVAMDYWKSQQYQQANPPSGKSDPGAHYAGDVAYDQDPDTKYLDPLTAAQVRMAKVNKRANIQAQNMHRPTPMGQLNLTPPGVKAAAAAQSIDPETYAAHGGIMHSSLGGYAAGGNPRLLKGPGDGMSDNIPATISGKQPARLADGEFVVPADVVSHLGNGSTDAGAKVLHEMMNKVRQARTGNSKQGKQINAHKFVPT